MKIKCKTCGYETEKFNGWAFCGPCRTPGEPGYLHAFKLVKEGEEDSNTMDDTVFVYIECGTGGAITKLEILSKKSKDDYMRPYSLLYEGTIEGTMRLIDRREGTT